MKIKCMICHKDIEVKTQNSFFKSHLIKEHNISSKEYYDMFFKLEKEDECSVCGEKTKYISFVKGYSKTCGRKCSANNIERLEKIKKTKKLKYNDENYNNRNKSENTCLLKYGFKNVSSSHVIKNKKKETYLLNYNVDNYTKTEEYKLKTKKTCLLKYNVDNPSKLTEVKNKRKKTSLERYGVIHYSKSNEYRILNEKTNKWIPLENKNNFEIYTKNVFKESLKFKKELFDSWDGKCYYYDTLLDKNVHYNNKIYPTIDHKISIYYGYNNNIPYEEIGNINNLCICSRQANIEKGILNETDFKSLNKK